MLCFIYVNVIPFSCVKYLEKALEVNSRKQLYPWAPLSKQLDVAVHKRYVNEILQWLLGYRDDNVSTLLPSD